MKDINEKIDLYLNEGTSLKVYSAMLDSVNAAIKVIDAALKENKAARDLSYLKSAKEKLEGARNDLRMVPLESFKNIAIDTIKSVGKFFGIG